jgi:molybdopterin converting factor small subunit
VNVAIPSPLHSYTGGKALVPAEGATVGEVIDDLDRRYPGIKFRMIDEQDRVRPHILIWVGQRSVRDLKARVDGELKIVAALSGG